LIGGAAVSTAYALLATRWHRAEGAPLPKLKFKNPFAFWPVIGFALFLGTVTVTGRLISDQLGSNWTIAGAAVVGLVDVDAITVSLARLAPQSLSGREASIAILCAVAADTVSKIAIAGALGPGRFTVRIATFAVGSLAAGSSLFWAALAF
jgi:uncharacterized membrane protein (DUF4010 family)